MKKMVVFLIVIILTLSVTSIGMSEIDPVHELETGNKIFVRSSDEEKTCYQDLAKWTFMVYLNGDNNLQSWAKHPSKGKITWMESVGSSESLNIIYQFDAYDMFDGTHRYYVNSGSELIEELEEQNMGDPDTLVNFVDWGCSTYPAEKYCLVIWSHGTGWRDPFCYDETDDDYLTMHELKNAMNEIKTHLNKNIDIILFDSCLMSMIEVYYQLRSTVGICVGSEAMLPEPGCNYQMILDELKRNPEIDAAIFARHIVNESASYYSSCYMSVTMAALGEEDLTTNVLNRLDELATLLYEKFSKYKNEIKEAIANTILYKLHYRDLYNFTQEIYKRIPDEAIKQSASDLMAELEKCTIEEKHFRYKGSHGISIYLPTFSLKDPYDLAYEDLDLSVQTNWDEFINKCKWLILTNSYALYGTYNSQVKTCEIKIIDILNLRLNVQFSILAKILNLLS